MNRSTIYLRLSEGVVAVAGHRLAVMTAIVVVAVWSAAGVEFGLPTRWYLLTNVLGTVTTLLVLLIMQHSQNRDMHALQVKADELIRASEARNHLIGAERLEAADLEKLRADCQAG